MPKCDLLLFTSPWLAPLLSAPLQEPANPRDTGTAASRLALGVARRPSTLPHLLAMPTTTRFLMPILSPAATVALPTPAVAIPPGLSVTPLPTALPRLLLMEAPSHLGAVPAMRELYSKFEPIHPSMILTEAVF